MLKLTVIFFIFGKILNIDKKGTKIAKEKKYQMK